MVEDGYSVRISDKCAHCEKKCKQPRECEVISCRQFKKKIEKK